MEPSANASVSAKAAARAEGVKTRIRAVPTHATLPTVLFADACALPKDAAEMVNALRATNAALLAVPLLVELPAAVSALSRAAASLADALPPTSAAQMDAQQPWELLADANAPSLAAALRVAAQLETPAA